MQYTHMNHSAWVGGRPKRQNAPSWVGIVRAALRSRRATIPARPRAILLTGRASLLGLARGALPFGLLAHALGLKSALLPIDPENPVLGHFLLKPPEQMLERLPRCRLYHTCLT